MSRMTPTALVITIATLPAVPFAPAAIAQSFPEKPVRVIVPFPPGGAADIVARHITARLTENFGVQFIVDNRGGAGGAIGTEFAARAAPDGYTLLKASSSAMSILPHVNRKLPYDPLKSFTPIIFIGDGPNVLVVHPSVPAKSVKELVALARGKPQALSFASNGTGTQSHLAGELFMQRLGVRLLHVPYKGAAPAVIDTVAGHVSLLFVSYPSISAQLRAGRLRALGIMGPKRIELDPDIPTMKEAGMTGLDAVQWWGFYGPLNLPAPIVNRLNTELNRILRAPDMRKRLAPDAVEPGGGTPEDLTAFLKADFEKWGRVIRAAGIKGE